jgi:hypothetical protein
MFKKFPYMGQDVFTVNFGSCLTLIGFSIYTFSQPVWVQTLRYEWISASLWPYDGLCGLVVIVLGYRSRGPGFDSRLYQIFCEVVGLERGQLSLLRIIEELFQGKLALTSPTSGSHSVGIVRLRTTGHRVCLFVCLFVHKDEEGNEHGPMWNIILPFTHREWEKPQKASGMIANLQAEIWTLEPSVTKQEC